MTHQRDNRQVRIPGVKDYNVAGHGNKFGISPIKEQKLRELLDTHSPNRALASAHPKQAKPR